MRKVLSYLIVSVLLAFAPTSNGQVDDARTTHKTCAELLAELGKLGQQDRYRDALVTQGVDAEEFRPGTVFLHENGTVYFLPHGKRYLADIRLIRPEQATPDVVVEVFEQNAMDAGPLELRGSGDLDSIIDRAKELGLVQRFDHILGAMPSDHPWYASKTRLLERTFDAVEIIIDIPGLPAERDTPLRYILTNTDSVRQGIAHLSKPGRVRVMPMSELPGTGTIKDRLIASRPPDGILRFTISHQRGGELLFSDNSSASVRELAERRLTDGSFDVIAGCMMRPESAGWLVIDGLLFLEDIQTLAKSLDNVFSVPQKPAAPPGGPPGDDPPPSGGDLLGAATKALDKPHRRGFGLLGLALASLLLDLDGDDEAAAAEAPLLDEDETRGGVSFASVVLDGPGITRVPSERGWLSSSSAESAQIANALSDTSYRRSTVKLSLAKNSIAFFPSSSGVGVVQEPVYSRMITASASDEERARLQDLRARFWFVESDATFSEAQEKLQGWQADNRIILPFLFIDVLDEDPALLGALLAPFFHDVSTVGDAIPHGQDEAWNAGMFWCTSHRSQFRLAQYEQVAEILRDNVAAKGLFLRDRPSQQLAELWTNADASVWLTGVWREEGLWLPEGTLQHAEWVGQTSCEGRFAFVSLCPPDVYRPDRFYETKAFDSIASPMMRVRDASRRVDEAALVEATRALVAAVRSAGGSVAMSSCGKLLLLHE